MAIRDRLNDDLKTAMRAKDALRLSVIRGIKASVLQAETRGERTTLDDAGVIQVIVKEVKERRDSLAEFARAGRQDLVDKLTQELNLLEQYLPEPLREAELKELIHEAMDQTGASGPKDMGRMMGWLTERTRGRADGAHVSQLVKQALAERGD